MNCMRLNLTLLAMTPLFAQSSTSVVSIAFPLSDGSWVNQSASGNCCVRLREGARRCERERESVCVCVCVKCKRVQGDARGCEKVMRGYRRVRQLTWWCQLVVRGVVTLLQTLLVEKKKKRTVSNQTRKVRLQ